MPASDDLIPGNRSVSVGLNDLLVVGAERKTVVRRDDTTLVSGSLALTTGKALNCESGAEMTLTARKKIVIEAADSIEFVVGEASLVLKKDGSITLRGRDITIEGSGKINVKASGDVSIRGSKVQQN
jgi:type VI secretion system secreted protein VgrG